MPSFRRHRRSFPPIAAALLLGLCASGALFAVPTVPMLREEIKPIAGVIAALKLTPDSRFTDRIKWYIQPIVFGGSATLEENIAWVTLEQHTDLVKWWNNKYRELSPA